MQRYTDIRHLVGVNRKRMPYRKTFAKKKYAKKAVRKTRGRTASKKKRSGLKRARKVHMGPRLGGCALNYIESQYNPFKTFSGDVCVPDFISMPSYKTSFKSRGTFYSNGGAGGCAYILLNPYLPTNGPDTSGGPITNPGYCAPIWFSNANTYVAPGVIPGPLLVSPSSVAATIATTATAAYWDSEITAQSAKDSLIGDGKYDWRIVSVGIKIKYAGNVMNRKGQIILWADPQNSNYMSLHNMDENTLLKYKEASFEALGDGEYCVTYHPRNISDLAYSSEFGHDLNGLAGYPTLLIAIYGGTQAAGDSYTFEAVSHWELTGSSVPARSKSTADPSGFACAQGIIPTKPSLAPAAAEARLKVAQGNAALSHLSGTNDRVSYSSNPFYHPPGPGVPGQPKPPPQVFPPPRDNYGPPPTWGTEGAGSFTGWGTSDE